MEWGVLLHSWDQVVKRTTEKENSFLFLLLILLMESVSSSMSLKLTIVSSLVTFPRNVSFSRDGMIQIECYLHWLVQEWENEEVGKRRQSYSRKKNSWSNSQFFSYTLASCFPSLFPLIFRSLIFKSLLTNNTCVGILICWTHVKLWGYREIE